MTPTVARSQITQARTDVEKHAGTRETGSAPHTK